MKTNQYTIDLGDQSQNPLEKCFCEAPDKCLKKGVMDLYKCVGIPIIASLPHLYLTDPSYTSTVSGLRPTKVSPAQLQLFD